MKIKLELDENNKFIINVSVVLYHSYENCGGENDYILYADGETLDEAIKNIQLKIKNEIERLTRYTQHNSFRLG